MKPYGNEWIGYDGLNKSKYAPHMKSKHRKESRRWHKKQRRAKDKTQTYRELALDTGE